MQPGVYDTGDFAVTLTGGLTFSLAAGIGFVKGEFADERYRVPSNAAVLSSAIPRITAGATDGFGVKAADATLPRVDQLILRMLDHAAGDTGQRRWEPQIWTGNPTAGATLDNRTGFATLPARSLLIRDFLVAAGQVNLAAADSRDRRPWARGALASGSLVIPPTGPNGDLYTATSAPTVIGSQLRVECSGRPLKVTLTGWFNVLAAAGASFSVAVDGVVPTDAAYWFVSTSSQSRRFSWDITPTPGSHLIQTRAASIVNLQDVWTYARAGVPLQTVIEEATRQSAANG